MPPPTVVTDTQKFRQWLDNGTRNAFFVSGSSTHASVDPLRALLREGYGFIIWYPDGLARSTAQKIKEAVRGVPTAVRRKDLPEMLLACGKKRPSFVWDDPQGRRGFELPPLMVLETP
jgi:hypothetical protein